ncbi:hypothetical protein Cni_G05766 [Canna indica]|uniref:Cytoplasmic tRNA 2-thiolation protein 2 n=1 Tax=Canna indica TaxID=4628 RepID=A0AAQ3Q433_9LILI|nr:hypothetical protein Cni_G05766 [Canna indica]
MASCGGGVGACHQSHCQRSEEDGGAEEEAREMASVSVDSCAAGGGDLVRCPKCGEEAAAKGGPRVLNGMCPSCFHAHLFGKFKLAVTTNAMISPTDKVLVAFSGGPASRVALQFIHEMQCKSLESWDASKSQALPVFSVGVVFIDESIISVNPSNDINKTIEEIRPIVSPLSPPHKDLHVATIENICSMNCNDGKTKLKKLLDSVPDATGKEDLLEYLRMHLLQKIALDNGYNKLVLGSCTSTLACHVISATAKGQGYSLPADVQYVDARWEVPVVLPLHDCVTEELKMLCHLDGMETLQLLKKPSNSINSLISSFISHLRDENPSRERTIVRTAEKLKPFGFNKFVEDKYHEFLPSRLRCKFQNTSNSESALAEVFCPLCGSPLSEPELQSVSDIQEKSHTAVEVFTAHCCESCSFQILPKEPVSLQQFYSILPQPMTRRVTGSTLDHSMLRELIGDCLLVDDYDNDGT